MNTPESSPEDAPCHFLPEQTEILRLENFAFTGDGFRKLMGPGIYIVWSDDCICLYVGMAANLLARLSRHHVLPGIMKDIFRICVVICRSEEHARELESFAIAVFRPTLNKTLPKAYLDVVTPVGT